MFYHLSSVNLIDARGSCLFFTVQEQEQEQEPTGDDCISWQTEWSSDRENELGIRKRRGNYSGKRCYLRVLIIDRFNALTITEWPLLASRPWLDTDTWARHAQRPPTHYLTTIELHQCISPLVYNPIYILNSLASISTQQMETVRSSITVVVLGILYSWKIQCRDVWDY